MGQTAKFGSVVFAIGLTAIALSQSGGGGGGGGGFGGSGFGGGGGLGGGQGGQGGAQQGRDQRMNNAVAELDRALDSYLNGPETKAILTPGEYVEYKLQLKTGQVIVAEARSEAFDPALEIVDPRGKVLSSNDDRYPGDQRPLLLWRCPQNGEYDLHVRCFHDKSGGSFFMRTKTYTSVDLANGPLVEHEVPADTPFLLRLSMKAGQIEEVLSDAGGPKNYLGFDFVQTIAPDGLPEEIPSLSSRIAPAVRALVAPVDGDYYCLERPYGADGKIGKIHVASQELTPQKLSPDANGFKGIAPTNQPVIWELPVKKGDLLEATTPELNINSSLKLADVPDFSQYDLTNPDKNPFYPRDVPIQPDALFYLLPARSRDSRKIVFRAEKNGSLWLASNGFGPSSKNFVLHVQAAAQPFVEQKPNPGKLRIADTDYWAFDAKAGDVMTFASTTVGFQGVTIVRDPDLVEINQSVAALDQFTDDWKMIAQKPGRYLVAVSCLGDGGGGEYSLSRRVYHATEFNKSSPASSEISAGQTQVWKFAVTPKEPLLIRWKSSDWTYDVSIYDDKGNPANFQHERVDSDTEFGILTVSEPITYVIVLTGRQAKATYSINLSPLKP